MGRAPHDYALEIFGAEMAGDRAEVARLRALQSTRWSMSRHEESYRKAIGALADGVVASLVEMASLDADREKYPPAWYQNERRKLVDRTRVNDENALAAIRAYREGALTEARQIRAAAEANRDPAARMADELERARLAASPTGADDFAAQARAMLEAGQPRRASLLLGVALDKGWRGGFELDRATGHQVSTLPRLRQAIEDALDGAEPARQQARAIEDAVAQNTQEFRDNRVRIFAKYGLGVNEDGSMGTGQAVGVARASISAKVAALRAAQESGAAYREPDGALASAPSGGTVRAKE